MRKNRLVVPAHPKARTAPTKSSGQERTRLQLLEAAGEVFGEKGFERATGKEICERAGTNTAAINYHFGGMVGLYAAAVHEAVQRLASFEALQAAVATRTGARDKLEAFVGTLVRALTGPAGTSWAVRVLGREITAPSPELVSFREKEMFPKMRLIRAIVSELTGLPEDHAVVARGCLSVIGPCFLLLTSNRAFLRSRFPAFSLEPKDADELVRHIVDFACAGLSAVANRARRNSR